MTRKQLSVLIAGKPAGNLSQEESGTLSFQYLRSYRGAPLSSTMPLSTKTYRGKMVANYLWGLLPEDPAVRKGIAIDFDISPNNPFALLGAIGLDCPGAVQFCRRETDAFREERLVPISDTEIAHRLSQDGIGRKGWTTENERWSLGGQQNKFALRRQDDRWYSCEGSAPTTHILKSGIRGLSHQALNEYVCMSLASKLGIKAARVDYHEFEGEPAVIIERYDRKIEKGTVIRLHQEDLCQALNCPPSNKYTADGGPSCTDVIEFLASTKTTARTNVASFLQMLIFNYLIAATDAHAKNHSIMLGEHDAHRLAPMYDVASIAPYVDAKKWTVKPPKLAMSIGGENRIGRISANDFRKLVDQCELERLGITAEGCIELTLVYAEAIPEKLAETFNDLEHTESAEAAKELRERMEKPIEQLCEKTRAKLQG